MSDQELDDLFKDASGKMDAPFDASDWQQMETLLDAKSTVEPSFWNWKKYTWATVLFISSVALIELWSSKQTDKTQNVTETIISDDSSASVSITSGNSANKSDRTEQYEAVADGKETSVAEKQILTVQKENKEKLFVSKANNKSLKKRSIQNDNDQNGNIIDLKNQEVKVSYRLMSNDKSIRDENTSQGQTNKELIGSDENQLVENDTLDASATTEVIPADSVSAKVELLNEDKSAEKNQSFSLKLALSPDFSSVGYFTPGKTGFNYGLIVEYAFSKHVSASLGGIWSKKLYRYETIENYSYGQVLNGKTIDGDCRILDVPLNVNYYFNPGNRFTIYASLGLSSYIMFKEDYKYDVIKNGNSYDYATHVERKNNEWFKMTNISMGLQYRLRNHWALQIEPFVKAPLSGIGEGDYKLVSSGAFVNIKYIFK